MLLPQQHTTLIHTNTQNVEIYSGVLTGGFPQRIFIMYRLTHKKEVLNLFQSLADEIIQKQMDYTPASRKLAWKIGRAHV